MMIFSVITHIMMRVYDQILMNHVGSLSDLISRASVSVLLFELWVITVTLI